MKRSLLLVIAGVLFAVIISGCGESSPTPTTVVEVAATEAPTEAPTNTPEPTDTPTPLPTDTPAPTDTPTPIPTDTPTPTPVPQLSVLASDRDTGELLESVTIELTCLETGAAFTKHTDTDGEAVFSPVPEVPCDLSLSITGFRPVSEEGLQVVGETTLHYELMPLALAEISVESSFLREGPGTIYNRAGEVHEGDLFEIVGNNDDGSWLLVIVVNEPEEGEDGEGDLDQDDDDQGDDDMDDQGDDDTDDQGDDVDESVEAWLAAEDASITGDLERVEVVEAPPTPTPAPVLPTPTPEVEETVVVYYLSNPNDILGVFPERPFNANALYNNMLSMRGSLWTMQQALPGTKSGDAEACNAYVGAYNNILYSGVFYSDVPPEWWDIDDIYFISFIYSLDRTRPAYLSCVNAGRVDDFNHELARMAVEQTLNILVPAVDSAAARL